MDNRGSQFFHYLKKLSTLDILTFLSVISAIVVGVLSGFLFPSTNLLKTGTVDAQFKQLTESIRLAEASRFESDIQNMNDKLAKLETDLTNLTRSPKNSPGTQLNRLESTVNALKTDQTNLNRIIMDNPIKALEVVFLRKDIDNLEKRLQTDLVSVNREIERVYDLNKWLLGLMITIALSILGIAVPIIFRHKKPNETVS